MPPFLSQGRLIPRAVVNPGLPSSEFLEQWKHPGDVIPVLLVLGGDVVGRALAQMTGGCIGPPSFSFGWVAYSVTALVSAVGENKLMPEPHCRVSVIHGETGYSRDNVSWILGRLMRDYDYGMDSRVKDEVDRIIQEKWEDKKAEAKKKNPPGEEPTRPLQAGLCVAVYKPKDGGRVRQLVDTEVYAVGWVVAILQLGIAAIPCGIWRDWGVLLITAAGVALSCVTAILPQWRKEKWAGPILDKDKKVVLTRYNGSQHAIVILGRAGFLDLEALATGPANVDALASNGTRWILGGLALLWILLLISAAGLTDNTWFLLAVGGIGTLQNVFTAGSKNRPETVGLPIEFVKVFANKKVMSTLFEVETVYPRLGSILRDTFFPGKLNDEETAKCQNLEQLAQQAMTDTQQRAMSGARLGSEGVTPEAKLSLTPGEGVDITELAGQEVPETGQEARRLQGLEEGVQVPKQREDALEGEGRPAKQSEEAVKEGKPVPKHGEEAMKEGVDETAAEGKRALTKVGEVPKQGEEALKEDERVPKQGEKALEEGVGETVTEGEGALKEEVKELPKEGDEALKEDQAVITEEGEGALEGEDAPK